MRDFFEKTGGKPATAWPIQQWTLADLTLAAFYYNPQLEIARARVADAGAAIITAGTRPNPTVNGDVGGETAPESPWIAGFGFSLPIETAGKRAHRITAAERLADVARWNLASTAWSVRSQVRSAFIEYLAATRNARLLEAEERLRAQQLYLLEQRLAVGMISRPELDLARIEHSKALLDTDAAQGRLSQAQALLAAVVGVPRPGLTGVQFSWAAFDQPPSTASLSPAKIREDAVLNRLDIRRALADYSASEAALRLQIARQYPDVDLGPDYAFEEGVHLFSLAAGLTLPVFNRNQGPIHEALARRQEMAAKFLSTQASGVAASEQALAKYTAALNQLAQARQLIEQSQAQEQAAEDALQAGQGDQVAINGSRLQTAVTRVAELDALYRAQQALGNLEDAVQRPLLPGDIQPVLPNSPVLQRGRE